LIIIIIIIIRINDLEWSILQDYGTGAVHPLECIGPLSDRWQFSATRLVRVAKQARYAKPWHPGPYGHQMMAMIFSHRFLQEFKKAAQELLQAKPIGMVRLRGSGGWVLGFFGFRELLQAKPIGMVRLGF